MKSCLILITFSLVLSGCELFKSRSQTDTVYLTSLIENGEKVWRPAKLEAYAGNVVFEVENTLDAPHGFVVKGVKEPIVVGPKKTIKVKAKMEPGIYPLECHLHPTHGAASIEIVSRSKKEDESEEDSEE